MGSGQHSITNIHLHTKLNYKLISCVHNFQSFKNCQKSYLVPQYKLLNIRVHLSVHSTKMNLHFFQIRLHEPYEILEGNT